jgi:hypothetical protein
MGHAEKRLSSAILVGNPEVGCDRESSRLSRPVFTDLFVSQWVTGVLNERGCERRTDKNSSRKPV